MLSTMRIANATPDMRPDPPKIETPPSSTIVIISNSNPLARSARAVPSRAANRIPASPATVDDETNSEIAHAIDLERPRSGRRRLVTDHVDVAADDAAVQHDRTDREDSDEQQDRERQRADQIVLPEGVEPVAGTRPTDRSSTRMRAAPRQAINPASVTTSDGNSSCVMISPCRSPISADTTSVMSEDQPERQPAALVERRHHARREAHHRGHRQVDLAGDDHERHGDDDDDLLDRQLEQVDEVVDAQVPVGLGDVEDDRGRTGPPPSRTRPRPLQEPSHASPASTSDL